MSALLVLKRRRIKRTRRSLAYVFACMLQDALKQLGIQANIVDDHKGGQAAYVFGLWDVDINLSKFSYGTAIYCTSEQLPYYDDAPERFNVYWNNMRDSLENYEYVFEHSSCQTRFLQEHGIPAIHFPWGYSSLVDKVSQQQCEQVYRAMFIGGITPRRRRVLEELKVFSPYVVQSRYTQQGDIIAKACVHLNIHNTKRETFEALRVVCLLLGNRAFVISEPYEDSVPLISHEHLIICPVTEMKEQITYYLNRPVERSRIATAGYEFVKSKYTMTENLRTALGVVGLL